MRRIFDRRPPRSAALLVAVALLAACGGELAPQQAAAVPTAETLASEAVVPEAAPRPTIAVRPVEEFLAGEVGPPSWLLPRVGVEPGALVLDWGDRPGWDPGRPGAARGALLPLDPTTGEELTGYYPLDMGQTAQLVVSPDGRTIAASVHRTQSSGGELRFFDLATWSEIDTSELDLPERLGSLVWSPDGSMLIAARQEAPWTSSELWVVQLDIELGASAAVRSAEQVAEFDFTLAKRPLTVDGRRLYALAYRTTDGVAVRGEPFIAAIDLESGSVLAEIPLPGLPIGQQFEERFAGTREYNFIYRPAIVLAPDGGRLYVVDPSDDRVTIVDLHRMRVERTVSIAPPRSALARLGSWLAGLVVSRAEAKGGVYLNRQALLSPDGSRLYVTGTADQVCEEQEYFACSAGNPVGLQVIDTTSMELLRRFDDIGRIVVSPDGRWILGTGRLFDYTDVEDGRARELGFGLTIIDARTLEVAHVEPETAFSELTLSADGRHAFAISEGPGYVDAMSNRGRCTQTCNYLHVVEIESAQIVARRELYGAWVRLIPLPGSP